MPKLRNAHNVPETFERSCYGYKTDISAGGVPGHVRA